MQKCTAKLLRVTHCGQVPWVSTAPVVSAVVVAEEVKERPDLPKAEPKALKVSRRLVKERPGLPKAEPEALKSSRRLSARVGDFFKSKPRAEITNTLAKTDEYHEVAQMDGGETEGNSKSLVKSDLSLNRTNRSKLPLNTSYNTNYPFICPGCRKRFELFSGFVLHIEKGSCESSICHEIEHRINTFATQLFDTYTCDGSDNVS